MINLECDYLVVGAGAASLAFIDTIITELPSVKIVLVDKNPLPGGHWQHAYDFVHLHQPSVVYGLASRKLEGSWLKHMLKLSIPWKHRASKQEILTYYNDFIQEKVASGNIKFFPNCEYDFKKGHSFFSLDGTKSYDVKVKEKLVNGVLGQCIVPSQNPVQFPVDEEVTILTPNEVYQAYQVSKSVRQKKYVVLGAGKTSMDTVVYLQRVMKVKAKNIHWVISNDVWMLYMGSPWSKEFALIKHSGDEDNALQYLEDTKKFSRLDPNITPTKLRYPVVGPIKLRILRSIKNVIRKGRVSAIRISNSSENDTKKEIDVHFDGSVDDPRETFFPAEDYVFVHCTSPGPFNNIDVNEIFVSENQIDLYALFAPPITISMSTLGYLEAARRKGKLDLNLGEKLIMAINGDEFQQEVENKEQFSVHDILKAVVLPFDLNGNKRKLCSIINTAVFFAIADIDPFVPFNWMKNNRLSLFSIPGSKSRIYENLDDMISKGSALGFSEEYVEVFRLLQNKLEPLKGR